MLLLAATKTPTNQGHLKLRKIRVTFIDSFRLAFLSLAFQHTFIFIKCLSVLLIFTFELFGIHSLRLVPIEMKFDLLFIQ